MRRTKIVATIGPASRDPDTLARMVEAGLDVARLNFSHGDRGLHAENAAPRPRPRRPRSDVRWRSSRTCPGPSCASVRSLTTGWSSSPASGSCSRAAPLTTATASGCRSSWAGLAECVDPEDVIYLADGADSPAGGERSAAATCEVETIVEVGGSVASRQGLNIPGNTRGLAAVPEEDLDMLRFGESIGVDLVALSFVRTAEDVEYVRRAHPAAAGGQDREAPGASTTPRRSSAPPTA